MFGLLCVLLSSVLFCVVLGWLVFECVVGVAIVDWFREVFCVVVLCVVSLLCWLVVDVFMLVGSGCV